MPCKLPQINNQDGFLMVIALLIMATLAVAGLLVTNDAVMEGRVGRNYAIYIQSVNAAEAAAKEVMQSIDSIFENVDTSLEAIEILDGEAWQPQDGYNTHFEFDPAADWATAFPIKDSVLKDGDTASPDLNYMSSVGAFAVLVNQATSVVSPGLSGTRMREYFEYDIYCRTEHAGAGNSETILVIGYRQEKL